MCNKVIKKYQKYQPFIINFKEIKSNKVNMQDDQL